MMTEYRTQVYYTLRAFIFLSLVIAILIPLEFWLFASVFKMSAFTGVSAIVITIALPLVYIKKIKERYTKNAFFKLDDNGFIIVTSNIKRSGENKTEAYRWDDLQSYKVRFTQSKLTYMDLYFRDGMHHKYGFIDNKTQKESLNGDSIFSVFFSYIKRYNINKKYDERIMLKPGLLTTHTGTIILSLVGLLFIIAVAVCITKSFKSFPFLLIGGSALLVLLLQRKNDKELYTLLRERGNNP